MSPDKEQEIINLAPYMYRYDGWNDITKALMCYGLSVGNGWYEILKQLTLDIVANDPDKTVRVFQVKEKFGTLRFYIDGGNQTIQDIITEAENKTETICEACGNEGRLNTSGWFKCLCEKCREKKNV